MSSSQDNDDQQRFALGFLFALIALVVATVVGVVVYKRAIAPARAPAAAVVAAPEAGTVAVAPEVVDGPTIQVENGVVKFYFASGKTDVAPGADEALADVAKGVAAGKKALVSGYHDTTGDAAVNEELAKQRAVAVRVVLVRVGVPEDKVELKKPEVTTGSGDNAQARRVEVLLID